MRRRFWLLYPAWIALCAALFIGLGGAEDPSRRRGRLLSNDAAAMALRQVPQKGFEAVHVAYSPAGEAGDRARWIVLCDRVPHTALSEAVVVELDARDGHLLAIRKPVN